jgi:RimJ/RimL family protein N-acetyltransferase
MASLPQFVGREIGVSEWHAVPQQRIDEFADCTGDRQWIHVDVERAQREGPFGGTIAHGYLTLALVTAFMAEIFWIDGLARRALLRATEAAARSHGAEQIELNVSGDSRSAIDLYAKAGFRVVTQQMRKRLS